MGEISKLRKTYADGSSTVKTYDAFNRLSTETSARGPVAAYAYETARGLLTGISYSDTTPGIAYSYNHLGALTQVTDAAGTRSLGYNTYGEAETDSLVAGEKTHKNEPDEDSEYDWVFDSKAQGVPPGRLQPMPISIPKCSK